MRTHSIQRIVALLLSLIAARAVSVAQGLRPLHKLDLQNELCPAESQQLNYPKAGVDFISEEELLVYTVCRVNVALSLRDVFRTTDPNHLKAVIVSPPAAPSNSDSIGPLMATDLRCGSRTADSCWCSATIFWN